ncbi:MAG: sensor histidine kinase [Ruminococcus sp.]
MKRSQKFLVVFLVLTAVFSAVTAAVSAFELERVRKNTNSAVVQILENVKEKYPDVSERELAAILNDKSENPQTESSLKKYGINLDSDWAVYKNDNLGLIIIIANAVLCAVSCLALTAVFLKYCKNQKAESERLAGYLRKINRRNYDLEIKSNSEDEMSQLQSEIYKTTVMLREQADNSQKDKENLKQSLSDISHQLKTPLTSIMVMLDDIIEDENMPDDIRRDFLNDIRRSSNGISFLVQSILTLSKLDANSIVLKSRTENVKNILDDCVKNTAVLAEIKGVETSVECDESLTLDCDFKWLCEAITNIVKNCIEHTNDGGFVKLKGEKTSLCTKITVTDNGCGIAKEDLPHIFERFYKGRNSDENSVGIGLALAKTIVEKSGGSIYADSEQGKGTKFTITIFDINNSQ